MRVVIDFDGSQPGHWSGLLHAEAGLVVDAPFDGRLDLLRLLETLIDNGHDALDDSHNDDDDKKEWWR